MKRSILGLLFLSSIAYAAQPHSLGSVQASKVVFTPVTLAAINVLTADATGQVVACTDCVQASLCISSGSVNPGAFVILVGTGTFNGTTWSGLPHCR
jgi:hypothetical protein